MKDRSEPALPPAPRSTPIGPGVVLAGRFKVEQVLGRGAVSQTIAATQLSLDRRVVLKVLQPERLSGDGDGARFQQWVRAAVRLRSDHVGRLTDAGTLPSGEPYLVAEYLHGADFEELLATRGAFSLEEAVAYLLQASEGLAEAHSAGLIHGNLKPSNLFLAERADGSRLVKVLDFSFVGGMHGPDPGGSSLPAPELVVAPGQADERADIWSLGSLLHQLLTGRVPLPLRPTLVATEAEPESAAEESARVPPLLQSLIERCLDPIPAGRPRYLTDFAYALRPFASPAARASIDRVANTLAARCSSRSHSAPKGPIHAPGAPQPALARTAASATSPGLARTATSATSPGPLPRRQSRLTALCALAVVIVGVAAAVLWARRGGDQAPTTPVQTGSAPPSPKPSPSSGPLVVPVLSLPAGDTTPSPVPPGSSTHPARPPRRPAP